MTDFDVLKRAQILHGLSDQQLAALLATNPILTYQRDQVVFEAESCGREIYIVLEGEVAAKLDPAKLGPASVGAIERGSIELRVSRTFGPCESFGELALASNQPREATIVAVCDNTRLLAIAPQIFDNVLQAQMILSNIARDLAGKLR